MYCVFAVLRLMSAGTSRTLFDQLPVTKRSDMLSIFLTFDKTIHETSM